MMLIKVKDKAMNFYRQVNVLIVNFKRKNNRSKKLSFPAFLQAVEKEFPEMPTLIKSGARKCKGSALYKTTFSIYSVIFYKDGNWEYHARGYLGVGISLQKAIVDAQIQASSVMCKELQYKIKQSLFSN